MASVLTLFVPDGRVRSPNRRAGPRVISSYTAGYQPVHGSDLTDRRSEVPDRGADRSAARRGHVCRHSEGGHDLLDRCVPREAMEQDLAVVGPAVQDGDGFRWSCAGRQALQLPSHACLALGGALQGRVDGRGPHRSALRSRTCCRNTKDSEQVSRAHCRRSRARLRPVDRPFKLILISVVAEACDRADDSAGSSPARRTSLAAAGRCQRPRRPSPWPMRQPRSERGSPRRQRGPGHRAERLGEVPERDSAPAFPALTFLGSLT